MTGEEFKVQERGELGHAQCTEGVNENEIKWKEQMKMTADFDISEEQQNVRAGKQRQQDLAPGRKQISSRVGILTHRPHPATAC